MPFRGNFTGLGTGFRGFSGGGRSGGDDPLTALLALGAVAYYDVDHLDVSGDLVFSARDRIGAAHLVAKGGTYPILRDGLITHDGTGQYLTVTSAVLNALVNGDDEDVTVVSRTAVLSTSLDSGAQILGWGNATTQMLSAYLFTTSRWRLQRVTTTAEGGTIGATLRGYALRCASGTQQWRTRGNAELSADLSAAGSWTPTTFNVGVRFSTLVPIQFGAVDWSHMAVFPTALSDANCDAAMTAMGAA